MDKENEYKFYKHYTIVLEQSIYFCSASIFAPDFKLVAMFTEIKEKEKLLEICKTAIDNYIYYKQNEEDVNGTERGSALPLSKSGS